MFIKTIADAFLDLVFPPTCVHCGRVDTAFCPYCHEDLSLAPIESTTRELSPLSALAATGVHLGILQAAIQALKYHGQREIAPLLAPRLAFVLAELTWTFDMIIPVPLHATREAERGYNQAKELAKALALFNHAPYEPEALWRNRHTRPQVGLNRHDRLQNMEDAFLADQEIVHGKTLLLIDDVQTTGATLIACAEAALNVGANAVYGLTVTAAQLN